jgi:hypothetical protein
MDLFKVEMFLKSKYFEHLFIIILGGEKEIFTRDGNR